MTINLNNDESVSTLAVSVHEELFRLSKKTDVRYAEALVVVQYISSEYKQVETASQTDEASLPDDFVSLDDMVDMFDNRLGSLYALKNETPERLQGVHKRSTDLYPRLKQLAEKNDSPVAEKVIGLNQVAKRLNLDCASEGGNLLRPISQNVKYREQK